jgi:hypothetical protein
MGFFADGGVAFEHLVLGAAGDRVAYATRA